MAKIGRISLNLKIFIIFAALATVFFAASAWAQVPGIVATIPADKSANNLINTAITIQFDITMSPTGGWFEVEDGFGREITGIAQWTTTALTNDTLRFLPDSALRPGTHYEVQGGAQSAGWVQKEFKLNFITKGSSADATPPSVVSTYPPNGLTGVPAGTIIYCIFSEAMDPSTIDSTNILLSGPGISGPGDYQVKYDYYNGFAQILKNTQFGAFQTYTVMINAQVKDLRGIRLSAPYQWSFTSGAADTTAPVVSQTIPVAGAIKVGYSNPIIHAIFSRGLMKTL